MKNRYRIIAIILVLILLLTGCNIAPAVTDPTTTGKPGITGNPEKPTTAGQQTDPTEPEANVVVHYLPKAVENPDNLPVLKWVYLMLHVDGLGRGITWREEAVHEVNQMLADRDMPFRMQFVILDLDQRILNPDWFSRPEAQEALSDADLVWGNIRVDYMQKYLSPITEYVTGDAQPSLRNAVVHELNWCETTLGGEIYGIPTNPAQVIYGGWQINPELMKKHSLSEMDFEKNFWEMDELFADIYNNTSQPFLEKQPDGVMTQDVLDGSLQSAFPRVICGMFPFHQLIGECFAIDHSSDTPTVVNILETDAVRNTQEAILRYSAAGYSKNWVQGSKDEKNPFTYHGYVAGRDENNSFGKYTVPTTDSVYYGGASSSFMCGITQTSRYKSEAVALLNLIAEDEAFRNQLLFGKEGRDYKLVNGYYEVVTRDDGTQYSMSRLSPYAYFGDVIDSRLVQYPTEEAEGKTKLETYREQLDNVEIVYYPIFFDYSGFEEELAALEELREYYKSFTNADDMDKEGYDKMLQDFKAAGSDRIIAQLQHQLDAWLAANPDWQ